MHKVFEKYRKPQSNVSHHQGDAMQPGSSLAVVNQWQLVAVAKTMWEISRDFWMVSADK